MVVSVLVGGTANFRELHLLLFLHMRTSRTVNKIRVMSKMLLTSSQVDLEDFLEGFARLSMQPSAGAEIERKMRSRTLKMQVPLFYTDLIMLSRKTLPSSGDSNQVLAYTFNRSQSYA